MLKKATSLAMVFALILGSISPSFAADTTPPSAPTSLTATAVSSSQINLSWSASTDDVGVIGYRVERCQGSICINFTQISTPTGTSYSDTGLTADTIYRYQVRAVDAAENLSGYSSIENAATQAQTQISGNVYYVDQNHPQASDSNPGTQTLPWLTITKAANTIVAGDTVIVKAGRYTDPNAVWEHAFNPMNSGTAEKPIIFKSEPPLAAVVVPPNRNVMAFGIENRSYIIIDGFKSEGLLGAQGSSYITIQNSEVVNGGTLGGDVSLNWGLFLSGSVNSIIRNNYVHDMLNSGNTSRNTGTFMLFKASDNIIEYNTADCGIPLAVRSGFGTKAGDTHRNIWRYNIAKNCPFGFYTTGATDHGAQSNDNIATQNIVLSSGIGFSAYQEVHNWKIYNT